MHAPLDLRARRTQLKPNRARTHTILELAHAAYTDVLERVLQAGVEVRQERVDGALVLDVARHALCDLDA